MLKGDGVNIATSMWYMWGLYRDDYRNHSPTSTGKFKVGTPLLSSGLPPGAHTPHYDLDPNLTGSWWGIREYSIKESYKEYFPLFPTKNQYVNPGAKSQHETP